MAANRRRAVLEDHADGRRIETLTFSPDGRNVATGGAGGWIRVWDTRSGELRWEADASDVLSRTLRGLDREDWEDWEEQFEYDDTRFVTGDLVISPDGRTLLDHGMLRWSVRDGTKLARLRAVKRPRHDLVFASDSRGFVALDDCPRVLVPSADTETAARCRSIKVAEIDRALLGRNGRLLVHVTSPRRWFRLDLAKDRLELGTVAGDPERSRTSPTWSHTGSDVSSPDGATLVSAHTDDGELEISVRDLGTGETREIAIRGFSGELKDVFFDEAGSTMTAALVAEPGLGGLARCLPEVRSFEALQVRQWSLASLEQRAILDAVHTDGPFSYRLQIDVDPTGHFAAMLVSVGATHVWDLAEQALHAVVPFATCDCRESEAVRVSPDGRLIACFSQRRTARLCDTGTLRPWPARGGSRFSRDLRPEGIAFDARRRRLAVVTGESGVEVWDVPSARRLAHLRAGSSPVTSIAFTADGEKLVGTDRDRVLWVWDPQREQPLRSLAGAGKLSSLLLGGGDGHQPFRGRPRWGTQWRMPPRGSATSPA